jgi:hypothetical protein
MPLYQKAQAIVTINSATTTMVTATPDTFYLIDTATAAVTVTLPASVEPGSVVSVQNFPAGGFQVGGTVVGNNLTIQTTSPETFDDGGTSQGLGPPSSEITAAARTYFPTGTDSQAGYNGWVH